VPSPAVVWPAGERLDARLIDAADAPVTVSGRGEISAAPHRLAVRSWSEPRPVHGWAGPWPVEERWWDPAERRRSARLQVLLDDGSAWLLVLERGRWSVAAHYD
jgi:protein ImuB